MAQVWREEILEEWSICQFQAWWGPIGYDRMEERFLALRYKKQHGTSKYPFLGKSPSA
jgi:hypothetical protein